MTWDYVETHWGELSKLVCERWSDLQQQEIAGINGNHDLFVAAITKRYGISETEAERELAELCARCDEFAGQV
jgi:hypothetical protein